MTLRSKLKKWLRRNFEIPIRPIICSCGRVNLPHAKFCDNCGLTLEQTRTLST